MIGYVTLGTNDIARAATFYDELLKELGATRGMESDSFVAWSVKPGTPMVSVIKPFDGKPATTGNGAMVAIAAGAPAKVDALHARALALGGTDEGAPGPRGGSFYAAYCRDLDGNKLAFFHM